MRPRDAFTGLGALWTMDAYANVFADANLLLDDSFYSDAPLVLFPAPLFVYEAVLVNAFHAATGHAPPVDALHTREEVIAAMHVFQQNTGKELAKNVLRVITTFCQFLTGLDSLRHQNIAMLLELHDNARMTEEDVLKYATTSGVFNMPNAAPHLQELLLNDMIVLCTVLRMLHMLGVIALTVADENLLLGFRNLDIKNTLFWHAFVQIAVDPEPRPNRRTHIFNTTQAFYDHMKLLGFTATKKGLPRKNALKTDLPTSAGKRVNVSKDNAILNGRQWHFDQKTFKNNLRRWTSSKQSPLMLQQLAEKRKRSDDDATAAGAPVDNK